jgi:cysteine desulfurase/selenocysteine lyase
MDDLLRRLREEEFPIVEKCAYLNHAGVGPLPRRSAERMRMLAEWVACSGDRHWMERQQEAERVRGLAARLLGAREVHEVAFIENTSGGVSLVAEGLDWRPGDNVVGADFEFPTNIYPWMHLASRGVEFRRAAERDGRIDPEEILSLIDDRTRVLALSWVQYASGFRSDLVRLGSACRDRGVLFVVDVIQGLGALGLDVERDLVDVAVASSHKWLLGPEGIGILYVSDRVLERLRPVRVGWRSVREIFQWSDFDLTWGEGAKRLEGGSLNVYGIVAFGGSLEILLEAGPERIEPWVLSLAERGARGLKDLGFAIVSSRLPGETSGIVTAVPPGGRDAAELAKRLNEQDVVVAARAGRLRISPHLYNTEGEIDRFLETLEGCLD